jgi:hypothetical protein
MTLSRCEFGSSLQPLVYLNDRGGDGPQSNRIGTPPRFKAGQRGLSRDGAVRIWQPA